MKSRRFLFLCLLALPALLFSAKGADGWPKGFVSVTDMIPEGRVDVKYAGGDNFTGEPVEGYDAPLALLTVEAAAALKRAAADLAPQGFAIKVFDGYRPPSAVARFVQWVKAPEDGRTKEAFYPGLEKGALVKKGYISSKSAHSGGSAVDLTLVDPATGEELDMGTPFDFFGEMSHPGSKLVTKEQAANRAILRKAMEGGGFKGISTEWWHFTLREAPYPGKAFDFAVDYPPLAGRERAALLNRAAGGASKVIVASRGKEANRAVVLAYLREEEGWTLRLAADGYFGQKGVKADKREGDKGTPSGVYTFGTAFGIGDDPGATLPYRKVAADDVWVDDPNSRHYNRWASKSMAGADWKSAEHLVKYPVAYKYALSINYNVDPPVPGKGSAIFLHCSTGRPTAGCVSVPEDAMVFFLVFVDEETRILITDKEF